MASGANREPSSRLCNWVLFGSLLVSAQILLHGIVALVLFWVIYYRDGFGWKDQPKKEFNLHPVLMIAGLIYFPGNALLSYRTLRCCPKIYNKLVHTMFHLLAIPCIVIAFIAVLDSHNLAVPVPIPNFYSLHSWMGLVTMGLYALQFVVGFFSFLILLVCDKATLGFRASLVPIHAIFGLVTFLMAIATCLSGLTEKAIFSLGASYKDLPEEAIVVNALGVSLLALAIVYPLLLLREEYRYRTGPK